MQEFTPQKKKVLMQVVLENQFVTQCNPAKTSNRSCKGSSQ